MKTLLKQITRVGCASVAALGLVAVAPTASAAPLKVAYVYVSPIGDAGWTFQHDQGRKQMEKALAGKVTTKYVENVPEGADAERVIRKLAQEGNELIFTTSFGYMNPTEKVAKEFPKVKFMHATGYKSGANFANYNARFYEGRYLNGVLAGKISKSGIVGYMGAFPIPEVLQGMNAFMLGMRSVNPKAQMKVIWTNSWFDPGKEREAAMTLISQGADVITHHTDSTAAVQAAQEKGVYAFGYHSDMSKFGPKAQLSATTHVWGDYYTKVVKSVIDGTWKPTNVWGGEKEGMIRLAPMNAAVPAAVKAEINAKEMAIRSGKLHPFTGPIKGQDGAIRVAAGKTLSDDEMQKMDYFVEGVQGKVK